MNDVINFLMNKLGVKENECFSIDGKGCNFFKDGHLYHGDPNGGATRSAKILQRLVLKEYESIEKIPEKPKHEFKVGDRVRIRQWDDMKREFGLDCEGDICTKCTFIKGMRHLCGCTATIGAINKDFVELKDWFIDPLNDWHYSIDMLEPLTEVGEIKEINSLSTQDSTLTQTIEECAELIQSITKFKRYVNRDKTLQYEPNGSLRENIVEEIADVEVCIARLKVEYGIKNQVDKKRKEKICRTIQRLTNGD